MVNVPESNERTVEERKRDNIEMVRQLVVKIADVPGDEYKTPSIQHDLTKKEREEERKLM